MAVYKHLKCLKSKQSVPAEKKLSKDAFIS